ncbi:hypothetical protein SAMN05216249_11442 [Acetitomaculum ruminis DSM 5522]|uniref:HPr Serine kinase C-terminal domain-containing protein n=1 Tax=Acetitomaculum ruminis DSM 5522 TaxID=1120918 RepID=A0A1I0ZF67_9FIRM|nr:hypothetical protein [Acetitomaculum ruminis]SFB23170.1 hypothetical protein SAMN05216249_11442 [Acetitomaculum ruminis DSM 5522]
MEKYYYTVYGENIECDFEIPELVSIPPDSDITIHICLEDIPPEILAGQNSIKDVLATPKLCCFEIESVGYYFIQEGKRISIQCNKDFDPYKRKIFTLGSALGIAMILKGRIPIHGGTVVQNDKAVIITGDAGAGKSTISTALRLDGMGFLADDVSVLDKKSDNNWIVEPAYPQQKLCRDAAVSFGYELSDLIYIDEERDKFAVRFSEGFVNKGLPLKAFVELNLGEDNQKEDLIISEILGTDKIKCMLKNTYRSFIFNMIGFAPALMKNYIEILNQTPIYKITRKPGVDTTKKIINMIRGLDELK